MVESDPMTVVNVPSHRRIWIGVLLLVAGLLGHLFAARAIGGSYVAYRDHIFGFVLLSLVSGALIAGLGWRFWRRRDRKSTRLNSSHGYISYAVFCLKKKKQRQYQGVLVL